MEVYDPHKSRPKSARPDSRLGNFWVLIVSTVLVIVLFAIVIFVFFAQHAANRHLTTPMRLKTCFPRRA